MSAVTKSFAYGPHTVTIETGEIARQADAAVRVSMGDTVVLVTVCAKPKAAPGRDFLPLTVNYIEKTYAAGRIPGGFFKREGRPTEKETLTSRLIDRPLRPLFPDDFYNDVQVVATVLSVDPEIDSDIPALLGASAALALSGIPFNGPIGAARVGWKNGQYLLNPPAKELADSQLDLVVAGTEQAVLMVESEAAGPLGRSDAGRRGVRPPADAGGDQGHQGTAAAAGKPALEVGSSRSQRGARERRGHACAGRGDPGLRHHREAQAPRSARRSQDADASSR